MSVGGSEWEGPGEAWGRGLSVPLLAELVFLPSSSVSFLSSPQVVFPPGSPIPQRRTFPVLPSPPPPVPSLQHLSDALAGRSSPQPSLPAPSAPGPSAVPCPSPGAQNAGAGPQEDVRGPASPLPAPHAVRSVGCQTDDEDPLFPPMQAGPGAPREPRPSPGAHVPTGAPRSSPVLPEAFPWLRTLTQPDVHAPAPQDVSCCPACSFPLPLGPAPGPCEEASPRRETKTWPSGSPGRCLGSLFSPASVPPPFRGPCLWLAHPPPLSSSRDTQAFPPGFGAASGRGVGTLSP